MMDLTEIINRISFLRTRANLSARELSLRIDKSAGYINRLECLKNSEPSITVILDIIEVCGSSVEEFFYYSIPEHKADKEIIELLKKTNAKRKQGIIDILKS